MIKTNCTNSILILLAQFLVLAGRVKEKKNIDFSTFKKFLFLSLNFQSFLMKGGGDLICHKIHIWGQMVACSVLPPSCETTPPITMQRMKDPPPIVRAPRQSSAMMKPKSRGGLHKGGGGGAQCCSGEGKGLKPNPPSVSRMMLTYVVFLWNNTY